MSNLSEVDGMNPVIMKLFVVYFFSSGNYTLLSVGFVTLEAKDSRTEIKIFLVSALEPVLKKQKVLTFYSQKQSGKECSYCVRKVADIFQILKYRWHSVIKLFWVKDKDLKL